MVRHWALLLLWHAALFAAPASAGQWFGEKPTAHGFLRTSLRFRTPDFSTSPTVSTLRTELSLENDLQIYSDDTWSWSFHAITRPTYDAAFDIQNDVYGRSVDEADFGTGGAYPDNSTATRSRKGAGFPGDGGRIEREFTILNADIGSSFTGELAPAVAIDDVPFFGRVTAPVATRGPNQLPVGGNATGVTYEGLRDNFGHFLEPALGVPAGTFRNGGLPAGQGLAASLALASKSLSTPLNFYAGSRGKAKTFEQSSFDINRREDELKFDCFDNSHPTCMFREFYFDIERGDTFLRLGRQQIVWGKTDYFRLQDVVNPIDLGVHNLFASLDERRIPQLSADLVHSVGKLGPFEDVSLEAVWVFDRFIPDQFGQCGEPWAFTVACQARADSAAHQLLNISLARSEKFSWSVSNSQPGARIEFRLPKPAISFSVSAFYGFQKRPVTRFTNRYSVRNPNAAGMLFLQGNADQRFVDAGNPTGSVAKLIDDLSRLSQLASAPYPHSGGAGTGVWIDGFDPYDRAGDNPRPGGTLEAANRDLQNAWYLVTNVATPDLGGCAGVPDEPGGLAECGAEIATLALPWAGSEAELEYPRVWSIGASMDYEIPKVQTVLRVEMAADIDRAIQNTDFRNADGVSRSSVFKLAVGLDRPFKIPFVNPKRAALVSVQTFLEHIIDYDDGSVGNDGMVPYETNVISTLYMQNFWRNDTIILTNRAAVDWNAGAVIWGPKLRWLFDQKVSFEVGVNLIWGQTNRHNIRDLCSDGSLLGSPTGCSFSDPTTWQDGNWQVMNGPMRRTSESPFGFVRQSFGDRFMRRRDEFFFTVTRQF
jgi:hypothetical protein